MTEKPGVPGGTPAETGRRPCPVCGETMIVESKQGVTIDACPAHGIWLDKGELPAIIRKVSRKHRALRTGAVKKARRAGKVQGAFWGWWSLLSD
ncbi:MAG: TFIIB-type zinc ribbon-containing protein [Planctomycetota bacterium]